MVAKAITGGVEWPRENEPENSPMKCVAQVCRA